MLNLSQPCFSRQALYLAHRRDNTMEMYDNFNSMYAVHTTGSFKVEQDPYLGYVVSGSYDYDLGDWNQFENQYTKTYGR